MFGSYSDIITDSDLDHQDAFYTLMKILRARAAKKPLFTSSTACGDNADDDDTTLSSSLTKEKLCDFPCSPNVPRPIGLDLSPAVGAMDSGKEGVDLPPLPPSTEKDE